MISNINKQGTLKKIVEKFKRNGKKIVFTNGCFDILHPGHLNYLKRARQLGDCLVVGLNSDSSVRKLKGKGRPVFPQAKRAELLASLRFVDLVAIFSDPTPIKLIKKIKPDVLVKGADWAAKDIVGKDFVETYGGTVKRLPYIKGYSTTSLMKRIAKDFYR